MWCGIIVTKIQLHGRLLTDEVNDLKKVIGRLIDVSCDVSPFLMTFCKRHNGD